MVKYCPNCGVELEDSDSFCNECGYSFNKKQVTETPESGSVIEKIKSVDKKPLIIALIAVVIIGIAIVGLTLNSGTDVSISGVEFHIPAGYTLNEYKTQQEYDDIMSSDPLDLLNNQVKVYSGADGDIEILMADSDVETFVDDTCQPKTIDGKDGYIINFDDGECLFIYGENEKCIGIGVEDESLIADILV